MTGLRQLHAKIHEGMMDQVHGIYCWDATRNDARCWGSAAGRLYIWLTDPIVDTKRESCMLLRSYLLHVKTSKDREYLLTLDIDVANLVH